MTKIERKQRTACLLDRIRKIQNGTKNIGWGISEYSPIMDLAENNSACNKRRITPEILFFIVDFLNLSTIA